jgi:hypothetical protein
LAASKQSVPKAPRNHSCPNGNLFRDGRTLSERIAVARSPPSGAATIAPPQTKSSFRLP